MTERAIQNALWLRLREKGHQWMCPRYTPMDWWECDMFSVTDAGYFVEHEIKLSISDFRAEKNKTRDVCNNPNEEWLNRTYTTKTKHQLLAERFKKGPSKFYFVTPHEMLGMELVPEWAGLLTFTMQGKQFSFLEEIRAPKLHGEKVNPSIVRSLGSTFYWRFWGNRGVKDNGGPIEYHI